MLNYNGDVAKTQGKKKKQKKKKAHFFFISSNLQLIFVSEQI